MKAILGLLFGIVFGLTIGAGCCTAPIQSPVVAVKAPPPTYYKSVVKVQSRKKTNPNLAMHASGFAIDEKRIMTAGHFCVNVFFKQNANIVGDIEVVQIYDDQVIIGGVTEIEKVDEEKDLCILKSKWRHKIKPLELAGSYSVKIFDEITIIGSILGHFPVESKGRVIRSIEADNIDYLGKLKIAAHGNFGSSGSPVLNSEGKVIGVVIAKSVDHHILFATPLFEIQEFLDE